jgi:hypothetical protein
MERSGAGRADPRRRKSSREAQRANRIARTTANGKPAFRLFDVASGAGLALGNLTLQGGLAVGWGVSAEGGAVYNQGTLDLNPTELSRVVPFL